MQQTTLRVAADRPKTLGRPGTAMKRSVHDNFVLGYSVNCEAKTLVVQTEYRDQGEPFERTDVRFEGVLGYLLQDSLGGILFDIEQVDFDEVYEAHADLFTAGANYGWPFQQCSSDPRGYVKAASAATFRIQSSIGFDGFVVCKSMAIEAAQLDDAADDAAHRS
jgi:hypothetical protein